MSTTNCLSERVGIAFETFSTGMSSFLSGRRTLRGSVRKYYNDRCNPNLDVDPGATTFVIVRAGVPDMQNQCMIDDIAG